MIPNLREGEKVPARFIHLDGPSGRTRHLNPEETLPENTKRLRISGIGGSEFPEPTTSADTPCSFRTQTSISETFTQTLVSNPLVRTARTKHVVQSVLLISAA